MSVFVWTVGDVVGLAAVALVMLGALLYGAARLLCACMPTGKKR